MSGKGDCSTDHDAESVVSLLEECASLLDHYPEGVPLLTFDTQYQKFYKKELNVKGLGFRNLIDFVVKHLGTFFEFETIHNERRVLLGEKAKLDRHGQARDATSTRARVESQAPKKHQGGISLETLSSVLREQQQLPTVSQLPEGVSSSWVQIPERKKREEMEPNVVGIPNTVLDNLRDLVDAHLLDGGIRLDAIDKMYSQFFNEDLRARDFGFINASRLLQHLIELGIFGLKGEQGAEVITWNPAAIRNGALNAVLDTASSQGDSNAALTYLLYTGSHVMRRGDRLPSMPHSVMSRKQADLVVFQVYALDCFYTIDADYLSDHEFICQSMTDFYRHHSSKLVIAEEDVGPGLMAAAYHTETGFWLRAQVVKYTRPGVVLVRYVDDGAEQRRRVVDLYYLSKRFAHLPRLTNKTSLFGLKEGVPDKKNSDAAAIYLLQLVQGKEDDTPNDSKGKGEEARGEEDDEEQVPICQAMIKMPALSSEHPMEVVLFTPIGRNINQTLLDKGLTEIDPILRSKLEFKKTEARKQMEILERYQENIEFKKGGEEEKVREELGAQGVQAVLAQLTHVALKINQESEMLTAWDLCLNK